MNRAACRFCALMLGWAICGAPAFAQGPRSAQGEAAELFEQQIAPLLARHCLECHSGAAQEGGLDLSTQRSALARLEAVGLTPAAPADRRTLIRRLYFDLIGLPPEPEAVERFVEHESPEAYEQLVTELLASPHYGERWARHWLDVVRFGESQGFERNRIRDNAWRYRDWIITAFNSDLPYDEFVRQQIQALYGLDKPETRDVARNCLAARRLVERGVRMVQIWTGDGVSWDAHNDILGKGYKSHTGEALRIDQPVAGLIRDLKQRGLLESTVLLITTEFGRTPFAQADAGKLSRGRDHHPQAFSNLLVGAGLKPGIAYGATDALGYAAIESATTTYDLHATVLHLLGINHEQLTFYHNGIARRLTNVHGHVIDKILA